MIKMIKWEKPSGLKIETNDMKETVEYCESLGWTRNGKKAKSEPDKTKSAASGTVTMVTN